jgi:hypothetical protein
MDAKERDDEKKAPTSAAKVALRKGRDYYLENGLMVLTADFLRRRGYCCRSGCRHCPYGFVVKND